MQRVLPPVVRVGSRRCGCRVRGALGDLFVQTVEPVFGQIKECRGFRRFLLRGLGKVRKEWGQVSMAPNILRLQRVMA